jgi:hypothetical protein
MLKTWWLNPTGQARRPPCLSAAGYISLPHVHAGAGCIDGDRGSITDATSASSPQPQLVLVKSQ